MIGVMSEKASTPRRGVYYLYHFDDRTFIEVRSLPFTIGRTTGELILGNDRLLSRKHFQLEAVRTGSGLVVIDLDSANGTWVNGNRLLGKQKVLLAEGDWIRAGEQHFFFTQQQDVPTVNSTADIPGYFKTDPKAQIDEMSKSSTHIELQANPKVPGLRKPGRKS